MQALADISEKKQWLKPRIIDLLQEQMNDDSPAIKARVKKLLNKLI